LIRHRLETSRLPRTDRPTRIGGTSSPRNVLLDRDGLLRDQHTLVKQGIGQMAAIGLLGQLHSEISDESLPLRESRRAQEA
jgi:hypothetical protein